MVASALSHCFIGAIFIISERPWKLVETNCNTVCLFQEDFQAVKQNAPPSFTPSELTLPFASQALPSPSDPKLSERSSKRTSEGVTESSQTEDDVLGKASKALEKMTIAQLAIHGELIAGILDSFEVLPLLPVTLQIVGVLLRYSLFQDLHSATRR